MKGCSLLRAFCRYVSGAISFSIAALDFGIPFDRFSLFEVGDRIVALQDNPLTIFVYFGCRPASFGAASSFSDTREAVTAGGFAGRNACSKAHSPMRSP